MQLDDHVLQIIAKGINSWDNKNLQHITQKFRSSLFIVQESTTYLTNSTPLIIPGSLLPDYTMSMHGKKMLALGLHWPKLLASYMLLFLCCNQQQRRIKWHLAQGVLWKFTCLLLYSNVVGVVAVIFFVQRLSNLHISNSYIPAIFLPAKQLYSVVDPYFGIIALSTTHVFPRSWTLCNGWQDACHKTEHAL